jgi:uncharacterized protein YbgA (DUF1722 family)
MQVLNDGVGLYAQQIMNANPLLPVEEEGRLKDEKLRENFLQRVQVYHRWQQLMAHNLNKNAVIEFHTRHKYLLLAHCETTYRSLGRLIAQCGNDNLQQVADQYINMLMNGLKKPSSRGKHTNVLQHMLGYFKRYLDRYDKYEMKQLLEQYRSGNIPREVLLTMLKHYLRKFPSSYLYKQYYLNNSNPGIGCK